MFLDPDCGFGTFAERPVNSREPARAKLASLRECAEMLRAEHLGLPGPPPNGAR